MDAGIAQFVAIMIGCGAVTAVLFANALRLRRRRGMISWLDSPPAPTRNESAADPGDSLPVMAILAVCGTAIVILLPVGLAAHAGGAGAFVRIVLFLLPPALGWLVFRRLNFQ